MTMGRLLLLGVLLSSCDHRYSWAERACVEESADYKAVTESTLDCVETAMAGDHRDKANALYRDVIEKCSETMLRASCARYDWFYVRQHSNGLEVRRLCRRGSYAEQEVCRDYGWTK
jgi:hypothetical protein